ncbi:alpha/beta hydrolase family protein [Streptomyces sp. NPDC101455]|uniref:alpha/beta hydrolase family protein n=1 Tax=Streptomyces sp. NPDC101455 TaxID=3366142 RepID=UPI00380C6C63
MSMFQYFPTNYVWNLSVNIAMTCQAKIGEIDQICRPLIEASKNGDDGDTTAFFQAWCNKADSLVARAEEDVKVGRDLSAGSLYRRAWIYYIVAERMQSPDTPERQGAYDKAVDAFAKAVEYGKEKVQVVEVAYEETSYPALFYPADGTDGPAPTMIFCNGLDSFKEMLYGTGIAHEFARRGINTLMVDQPGTGGAIRKRGLYGRHDSEVWAGAAVDHLQSRTDVDPDRIGMMGVSLGGYFAPRAVAFEKRLKLCAVWGANYNWGELQKRRLRREGENPVPHYWEHVQWVFDKHSLDEFMAWAPNMTLEGVAEKITVPFLVTHGEDDKQIPMEFATPQYENAVNSPARDFHLFTNDEGGSAHAGADNEAIGASFISDWVKEHL